MKVIVMTHGSLGDAFKESAKMFFSEEIIDTVESLGLYPTDGLEDLALKAKHIITSQDEKEILLLVDMESGTPFNVSAILLGELQEEYNIECIAGLNMPLFMEILSMKDTMSIKDLVDHVFKISPSTIVNLREKLDF